MTQTMIPEDDKVYLKRYLAQYYNAKRRQDILKKRLAEIRRELDHPGAPSPQLDRGPVAQNYNSMPPLLIKLAEIEDRIADYYLDHAQTKNLIAKIEDGKIVLGADEATTSSPEA